MVPTSEAGSGVSGESVIKEQSCPLWELKSGVWYCPDYLLASVSLKENSTNIYSVNMLVSRGNKFEYQLYQQISENIYPFINQEVNFLIFSVPKCEKQTHGIGNQRKQT